jgi:hypothetical protein
MNFQIIYTIFEKSFQINFQNQPAKMLDLPGVVHPELHTVADIGTQGPTCHTPESGEIIGDESSPTVRSPDVR